MAIISNQQQGKLLALFNRGGYVLDFSTPSFDTFTFQSIGIPVCTKYALSKGKSLIAYLDEASIQDRIKLLSDLFDYYEERYATEYDKNGLPPFDMFSPPDYNPRYASLYKECKEIINEARDCNVYISSSAEMLEDKFSGEYLKEHIHLMIDMQTKNPTEAIGKAKELIESCCKTILDERGIQWSKDWDVQKLCGQTMLQLKLMPSDIPENAKAADTMKALLGNLLQVSSRMAELRNMYGSGHGKSANYKGLQERHAKLAVGASITLVTFLWETHEARTT